MIRALELIVFAEGGFELGVWVPEPGTTLLLLGGALGLVLAGRRR